MLWACVCHVIASWMARLPRVGSQGSLLADLPLHAAAHACLVLYLHHLHLVHEDRRNVQLSPDGRILEGEAQMRDGRWAQFGVNISNYVTNLDGNLHFVARGEEARTPHDEL